MAPGPFVLGKFNWPKICSKTWVSSAFRMHCFFCLLGVANKLTNLWLWTWRPLLHLHLSEHKEVTVVKLWCLKGSAQRVVAFSTFCLSSSSPVRPVLVCSEVAWNLQYCRTVAFQTLPKGFWAALPHTYSYKRGGSNQLTPLLSKFNILPGTPIASCRSSLQIRRFLGLPSVQPYLAVENVAWGIVFSLINSESWPLSVFHWPDLLPCKGMLEIPPMWRFHPLPGYALFMSWKQLLQQIQFCEKNWLDGSFSSNPIHVWWPYSPVLLSPTGPERGKVPLGQDWLQ